jgi:hypothetical protein
MLSKVVQPFWAALQRGEFITLAAESVGSYRVQGRRWIVAAGGVRPRRGRDLQGGMCLFQSARRSRWAGRPESRCGKARWIVASSGERLASAERFGDYPPAGGGVGCLCPGKQP